MIQNLKGSTAMDHDIALLIVGSLMGSVMMFLAVVIVDSYLRKKRWKIEAGKERNHGQY